MRCLVLLVLAFQCFVSNAAEEILGRVIHVYDGDSLALQDQAGVRHEIRMAAIDAPEFGQAHSMRSKRHLESMVLRQAVRLVWHRRESHGRLLGKVLFRPAGCKDCPMDRDAALLQLEAGMAWWYREFKNEQTLAEQGYYEYAEFDARMKRLGLWSQSEPIAPWVWRRGRPKAAASGADRFADGTTGIDEVPGLDGVCCKNEVSLSVAHPELRGLTARAVIKNGSMTQFEDFGSL
jgi:micrococcal nuclease